uniref:Uncharacterized protein n=1 Tax=Anguilla anguilla TaxID=7936 RepID=A0A0E9XDG4_ANGAN
MRRFHEARKIGEGSPLRWIGLLHTCGQALKNLLRGIIKICIRGK